MDNTEKITVPKPQTPADGITAEDIQAEITSKNEAGYCPCTIILSLEKIHNLSRNMEEINDEDREEVETEVLDFCSADIMEFDPEIFSLVLCFDTPQDAYMMDALRMLDRYRHMQEHPSGNEAAMFSISFLPDKYDGQAIGVFSFPVAYFRTLDEDGQKTRIHFLFREEDALYQRLLIDGDTMTQIKADAMRQAGEREASSGGLFEEDEEDY